MHSFVTRLFILLGLCFPALTSAATVVEYYNPDLDNYFITADPGEQGFVEGGTVGNWTNTGNTFPSGGSSQVCRFYGSAAGPNSHFYTADAGECAYLKSIYNPTEKSWKFESNDFSTSIALSSDGCTIGLVPIYRAYNNGDVRGIDSNHRITNNLAAIQEVVAKGWKNEGVVMCAPAGATTTPVCTANQVMKKGVCVASPPTAQEVTSMENLAVDTTRNRMKSPSAFKVVGDVAYSIYANNISGSIKFTYEAPNSFNVMLRGYAICPIEWRTFTNGTSGWRNELLSDWTFCYLY